MDLSGDDDTDALDRDPAAGLLTKQRLEAFSDGVFAIAATLLILELAPPGRGGDVWAVLGRQWPAMAAYAVSFLTIGIVWLNHHGLFAVVRRIDRTIQVLNIVLLLVVSFIPYPTAAVGRTLGHDHARQAAVLYGLTFAVGGSFFLVVRLHLQRHPELVEPPAAAHLARNVRRSAVGPVLYLVAVAVALGNAAVSLTIDGLLAGYYLAPGAALVHWPRRRRAAR